MTRYSLAALMASLLLFPASIFASGLAGYGAAGCGLGSIVMGPGSGFSQVFAATTNGTFGSQTFGITSGTSNCGDHGLVKLDRERELFAQENYTTLVKEMAQGKGENLSTLANLYQCPTNTHQEFGAMVQEKFNHLVVNDQTTSSELLSQIENQLTQHPKLAKSCNLQLSALH
jgi:hypothetical protein